MFQTILSDQWLSILHPGKISYYIFLREAFTLGKILYFPPLWEFALIYNLSIATFFYVKKIIEYINFINLRAIPQYVETELNIEHTDIVLT